MTFKELFSRALKSDIITQFQSLDLSTDITIEYCGKDEFKRDKDVYVVRNRYFNNKIIFLYTQPSNKFYISNHSDYKPNLSDDVVGYLEKHFSTNALVKTRLKTVLENLDYFSERLKEFNNTQPLMDIDDIDSLNQIFKIKGIKKEIRVDRNNPYSTWLAFEFHIVKDLDAIKKWVEMQLKEELQE